MVLRTTSSPKTQFHKFLCEWQSKAIEIGNKKSCTFLRTCQHRLTKRTQPFWHHSFKIRDNFSTGKKSFIAKRQEGKFCNTNKLNRNVGTAETPFIACCSNVSGANRSGFLPERNFHLSCGLHIGIHITPQHPVETPNLVRIWQQPFQCDSPPQFQETPRNSQKKNKFSHDSPETIRDRTDPVASANRQGSTVPHAKKNKISCFFSFPN